MLSPREPAVRVASEDVLSDYLDHVCAPLVGVVPQARRMELRREIRSHLEALAEDLVADGCPAEESLATALREFGERWTLGEAILREAALPANRGYRQSSPGAYGLAWFGLPSALCLLLLTQHAVDPGHEDLLRVLIPLALLTPVGAGALTGWTAPARGDTEVRRALALVAVFSLGVSLLLLPATAGFLLLALQAGYWWPAGVCSARAAFAARRHFRRAGFLRRTESPLRSLSSQTEVI